MFVFLCMCAADCQQSWTSLSSLQFSSPPPGNNMCSNECFHVALSLQNWTVASHESRVKSQLQFEVLVSHVWGLGGLKGRVMLICNIMFVKNKFNRSFVCLCIRKLTWSLNNCFLLEFKTVIWTTNHLYVWLSITQWSKWSKLFSLLCYWEISFSLSHRVTSVLSWLTAPIMSISVKVHLKLTHFTPGFYFQTSRITLL